MGWQRSSLNTGRAAHRTEKKKGARAPLGFCVLCSHTCQCVWPEFKTE